MGDTCRVSLRARVENGALRGTSIDWDPILIGPVFEIETSPPQFLEVRMRCQRTGQGELFWTETLEGRYGGFSQQKYAAFSVVGDDAWHEYQFDLRESPAWRGVVVSLRFDPTWHTDTDFGIDYLKLE